jgi:hypothetical protein
MELIAFFLTIGAPEIYRLDEAKTKNTRKLYFFKKE